MLHKIDLLLQPLHLYDRAREEALRLSELVPRRTRQWDKFTSISDKIHTKVEGTLAPKFHEMPVDVQEDIVRELAIRLGIENFDLAIQGIFVGELRVWIFQKFADYLYPDVWD